MSRIVILTNTYPYSGETFLENELKYIPNPNMAVICPIQIAGFHHVDSEKHKITVFHCMKKIILTDWIVSVGKGIYNIFKQHELKEIKKDRFMIKNFIKAIKFAIKSETAICAITRWIPVWNVDNESIVFYSYWFYEAAYIAARLHEIFPNSIFISRCHGYDLYKERHIGGYLPFRQYLLYSASAVYPISQQGRKYLLNNYGFQWKDKIKVCRLGTERLFKPILQKEQNHIITIVSCSNLVKVKRVHLLIEALMTTNLPLCWYHIGDGPMKESLLSLANKLPQTIQWKFLGAIPNCEVQKFYAEHYVDALINVSESEGIPVSIMEALSYGIPAIATDVGGVSEIIEDGKNGILLKKDFTSEELISAISFFGNLTQENSIVRINAVTMWNEKYNAVNNYSQFYNKVYNLI
ncbi:glycosyltransferase [Acidaminococcus fermentans]|uniref:glycosyltransferase n=1 Tax=Acidaminococcus fermentans TaxID=905 RepID=UPI00241CF212|nr:glycosyltransferase [Acidaminococcus fermentans]